MSMPCFCAIDSILLFGPTRIGSIRPILAASTAPCSELWSHGCATAVGVGGSDLQKSIRRWYLTCARVSMESSSCSAPGFAAARAVCFCGRSAAPLDGERLADMADHLELFLGALDASVAKQPARELHQPVAVPRHLQQLGQRRQRALGLVANDDFLLAA